MNRNKYSIFSKDKIVAFVLIIAVVFLIGAIIGSYCHGEEPLATVWVMCKPGSTVSIRRDADKGSLETGRLDCGDSFQTDGETQDGWIRCYGAGEGGWVFCGYVVTEKPEKIGERYVCNAVNRVACRKWMGGPQIEEKPWLKNG